MQDFNTDFEIIFKCMSGTTTDNGKFIMPLKEKLSYDDSSGRCDSEGFAICLDKIKSFIQGKTLNLELTKKLLIEKFYWWCESFSRLGLRIHLPENENEQKIVNSLTPYNSNWLRIRFQNHEIHSDDEFRGESWQQSGKLLSVFLCNGAKKLLDEKMKTAASGKAIIINEFFFSNSFIKTVKIQENWIRMRDLSIIIDKYRG